MVFPGGSAISWNPYSIVSDCDIQFAQPCGRKMFDTSMKFSTMINHQSYGQTETCFEAFMEIDQNNRTFLGHKQNLPMIVNNNKEI